MNRGFTLLETLLALLAISFCSLLLVPVIKMMMQIPAADTHHEDVIGILQIRTILSQSRNVEITPSMISFRYRAEDWQLSYHHQNIVKEPGYEIFLMHLENASFLLNDHCLHLQYQKEGNVYDAILYCE